MPNRLLCCVGPIKGGTTWLMWHLRHSHEVFFAPEKEIHFHISRDPAPDGLTSKGRAFQFMAGLTGKQEFNPSNQAGALYRARIVAQYAERFARDAPNDPEQLRNALEEYRSNLNWYRDYTSEPVNKAWYEQLFSPAGDKWVCDFSTSTCMMSPVGWSKLKGSANEVRAIYFIRNPYDRMWSHAKAHAFGRGEWDAFKAMDSGQKAAFMRRYRLDCQSIYSKRIKTMRRALGADNVLVLNFDDIERAPQKLLSLVSDFTGISQVPVVESLQERHAASPEMPLDWEAMEPFQKAFDAEIQKLYAMGFGAAQDWIREDVKPSDVADAAS